MVAGPAKAVVVAPAVLRPMAEEVPSSSDARKTQSLYSNEPVVDHRYLDLPPSEWPASCQVLPESASSTCLRLEGWTPLALRLGEEQSRL